MSKTSKAQKIRDYMAKHPDKTAKQVASALRVIPAYVYKVKSELNVKPKKEPLVFKWKHVAVAPSDEHLVGVERLEAAKVWELTKGRTEMRKATREEKISNPGVYEVPVTEAPLENVRANALDIQVGGAHYKNKRIQPVEFSYANNLNGLEASIVKRITRWRDKDGFQDLEKIKHEVDLLIELETKYPQGE